MSVCTVCSMDPCPHLKTSGGTSGAPSGAAKGAGIKYAPSTKPECADCGRIHRNIGVDNKAVCMWRAFSRARGEEFSDLCPDNLREAANWLDSGGWAPPVPKRPGKKAPTVVTVDPEPETSSETSDADREVKESSSPIIPTVAARMSEKLEATEVAFYAAEPPPVPELPIEPVVDKKALKSALAALR